MQMVKVIGVTRNVQILLDESVLVNHACILALSGLVPIRLGAQTVDPVTGVLAPVIGASLDVWKRTVAPVTVSQYLASGERPDSVIVSEVEPNHSCI